jgi:putative DNA methylase
MADSGILKSSRGKVRLIKPEELPDYRDPDGPNVRTAWRIVHQLVRILLAGGEAAAADFVANLGTRAEAARELAYRLYMISERKKRAAEALAYNGLVQSWPEIMRMVQESARREPTQAGLFEEEAS